MFDLLLTLLACALWYLRPALGPWPLLLIAAGRLARTLTSSHIAWRRTPFDWPLLLFLLSAAMGTWLAYDQAAGWNKFWVIVGGLALYDSLAFAPEQVRAGRWQIAAVRALLALPPAVIALYFLLTNDWVAWLGKLPWLDPAMRWFASWQPDLPGHRLHPNVAGGLIAALIPLQAAAVGRTKAGWPLIGLAALGLLMTASRGAWLALAAVAAVWAAWRLWGRRWPRGVWLAASAGLAVIGACGAVIALQIGPALFPGGRLELLRNSLDLALDTPFTGLGLDGFQMAYSSYVLMLHVGHTIHSHNLLLDIWLEQGLAGLAAFIWLLGAGVRAGQRMGADKRMEESVDRGQWAAAALVSLAVILAHGLVDDAFYGSRGVLLLFVPFAFLARGGGGAGAQGRGGAGEKGRRGASAFISASALSLALLLALLPQTRAGFQANLGTLLQTRAELGVYEWPKWPIQDALRRQAPGVPPPVDLAPAIARFRAALALDAGNVTANRRLGQIELSQGDDAAARAHLAAAYRGAPDQQANRFLLGESAATAGQIAEAVALWSTVGSQEWQNGAGRQAFGLRTWWYGAIGETEKSRRIGVVIEQLSQDARSR